MRNEVTASHSSLRPTNAASSGIALERSALKRIAERRNAPGLIYLTQWGLGLFATSGLVWLSLGTWWMWPAMLVHGVMLCVPVYAISHETCHGTVFRSRWLNDAVHWLSHLVYLEEPLHRRYTHTNHHTHTWHVGKDSQMPFDTPVGIKGWLIEASGVGLARFHIGVMWRLLTGRYSGIMREVAPAEELPKMTRNAWIFCSVYVLIACIIVQGVLWPLWFLVLPRLLGAPIMLLFTLPQHMEMQENSPFIQESTRSYFPCRLGRFLYMNMNHHIGHHLYPQIPFHALPALEEMLKDQLPQPDPGLLRTNWELFVVALRRSLGLSTKAPTIRQAPHMITEGGNIQTIAQRTM